MLGHVMTPYLPPESTPPGSAPPSPVSTFAIRLRKVFSGDINSGRGVSMHRAVPLSGTIDRSDLHPLLPRHTNLRPSASFNTHRSMLMPAEVRAG
jgi:hypothetical protein